MLQNSNNFLLFISLGLGFLSLLAWGYLWFLIRGLNQLKKSFFTGKTGQDLENTIHQVAENLVGLHENQLTLEKQLLKLQSDSQFSLQKSGVVRFNPFSDGGGNFSFSLALLDGHSNGFVITSMHGREQNRIYIKKILNGKSDLQLTQEEAEAITLANTQPTQAKSLHKQ